MRVDARLACKYAHMLDWEDIRCLLVVERSGSLAAAAREMGVHHATVGRRVANLEKATGTHLIERLPRMARLTAAGRDLVRVAAPMQVAADALARHGQGRASLEGTVTVSTLPALASAVIAPSLVTLRNEYPRLHIVLKSDLHPASLERGQADIAIGLIRPKLQGRVVRRVGCLRYGLYASLEHASKAPAEWTFVGYEAPLQGIAQQRWLDHFAAGRTQVFSSNDVLAQRAAVRAGLGVAALPSFLGDGIDGVVLVPCSSGELRRNLWMSVHSDVRRSLAVRVLMDHLAVVLATI
jgi:molybdate transport repressor ModE-like protein